MDWPEAVQMVDDGAVDLAHPLRMAGQQLSDRNARDAYVRLVRRGEFPLTDRAHPTRHAADCAADINGC
jgi:hypothetical protein